MSELRAFLENQKERWGIVSERGSLVRTHILDDFCKESIKDIDHYLERHKPPVNNSKEDI